MESTVSRECVDSTTVVCPDQPGGSGSIPTSTLHKSDWRVYNASISKARELVAKWHYAGGASNTAAAIHGLYRADDYLLTGIAWWIPPTRDCAAAWWPEPNEVLALSRLAIADWVPKNAESFLLMRSVKLLPARWRCLITFADTWRNHTGTIYKACGWEYLGLTKPERIYTLDGRMVSRKCGPKTRTNSQMESLGAECIGSYARHRFRLIRKLPAEPLREGEVRAVEGEQGGLFDEPNN